jgi:tRNA (guanine37-N1)-methyltransferase
MFLLSAFICLFIFNECNLLNYLHEQRINLAFCETVTNVEMHRVRLVAPGKWMLCASFNLPKVVAFGKPLVKVV